MVAARHRDSDGVVCAKFGKQSPRLIEVFKIGDGVAVAVTQMPVADEKSARKELGAGRDNSSAGARLIENVFECHAYE